MKYTFRLDIEPRAQKRDRICSFGGHARSYKDPAQGRYEAKLRALLSQDRPPHIIEGPVKVSIWCMTEIPASWSKKKRANALEHAIMPTGKPDIDNAAKQILDCMNSLIWKDDKQVVELWIAKMYDAYPRWEITVEEIL